ncbi:MAG TPA: cytochrome c oxidase assembly protein [Streptosporangiaceae bacterium]|nr:cytochrome c oxidase assembly protein [Streptosporangiaceae bacterium]
MTFALSLVNSGLLAPVYHGPPRLTPAQAFTEWSVNPFALIVIVLVAAAYVAGVRRVRRAGGEWPAGRIVAFCGGGLGFALIATCSFLAVYGKVLFYVRSFQTILLLLGVPLFIMLGRPVSLVIAASAKFGPRVEQAVHGRLARLITFPAITGFLLVVTPFVLYFSPWYAAGFRHAFVMDLTYLALVAPGMVFFWTLLRVDPVPRQFPYMVALWVTAAEVVGDAALGLAVIADRSLIAGSYYHAVGWPWGPTLASDQVIGGGALWVFGDIIGLPFLAALLIAMIREDESEAKVIDAQLDAEEAREEPALESEPAQQKLWWENDPRFAGRFAAVEPRQGDQESQ